MTKNKLDLIFKSYDIRGIYGDSIDQEIAYKIGKAFAEFVPDNNIICLLYTSPSPRDVRSSRMPSSA